MKLYISQARDIAGSSTSDIAQHGRNRVYEEIFTERGLIDKNRGIFQEPALTRDFFK